LKEGDILVLFESFPDGWATGRNERTRKVFIIFILNLFFFL